VPVKQNSRTGDIIDKQGVFHLPGGDLDTLFSGGPGFEYLKGCFAVRRRQKVFAVDGHHRFAEPPRRVFQSEGASGSLKMELFIGARDNVDRFRVEAFRKGLGDGR